METWFIEIYTNPIETFRQAIKLKKQRNSIINKENRGNKRAVFE